MRYWPATRPLPTHRLTPDVICMLPPSLAFGASGANLAYSRLIPTTTTISNAEQPHPKLGLSDKCRTVLSNQIIYGNFTGSNYWLNDVWGASESLFATLAIRLRTVAADATGNKFGTALKNTSSNHYPYTDGKCYIGTFLASRPSWTPTSNVNLYATHSLMISTRPGTNGWRVLQNGRLQATTTGASTRPWTSSTNAPSFMDANYAVEYLYLYKRALSDADALILHNDPYCFLRRSPKRYAPEQAAPAAQNNAAFWTALIGQGV